MNIRMILRLLWGAGVALTNRIPAWAKIVAALGVVFAISQGRCLCGDSPDYDATVAARRPLVIVNGVTQQIASVDYVSTVGGLSTNATAGAAGDIQTTTMTSSGIATVGGETNTAQTRRTGKITPTLAASQNNWNPTGLATASYIDAVLTANSSISGIVAQPDGTEIVLRNSSGSFTLSLNDQNAGSTAANRFDLLVTPILEIYQSATLRYNGTTSRWNIVGSGGAYGVSFPSVTASTILVAGLVRLAEQTNTTTGTQNDIGLNNTAVFQWNGATASTLTGFTGVPGGSFGAPLFIQNLSNADLTLAHGTGTANRQLLNPGGVDIVLEGVTNGGGPAGALYISVPTGNWYLVATTSSRVTIPTKFTSTKNTGTIALTLGTGTATVRSGAICVCTDTTANLSVSCAVATTTLTATGTASDVIAYHCF